MEFMDSIFHLLYILENTIWEEDLIVVQLNQIFTFLPVIVRLSVFVFTFVSRLVLLVLQSH